MAAYIEEIVTKGHTKSKPKAQPLASKADLGRVRRHALAAQGLLHRTPFGRGLPGAREAIKHMGYVQIDTISVVARAHHHVFRSRVPNFRPHMTHQLLEERSIFEYWSHAAAFLPMQDFRFSLPYKAIMRSGQSHWTRSRDGRLMDELLARIAIEGPLRSRDIESGTGTSAGWWDWKPAKRALEQLFMEGALMISSREGFEKSYDLTERVLPDWVDTRHPSADEFARHLVDQQLRCHALVTLKGMTYLRRNAELRQTVRDLISDRVGAGELEILELPSGEQFYCTAGLLDRPAPRAPARLQILSPFDNAVIQRERLQSIFGFDYQIECYLPEARRRYGYFCLPLLYRDQFVGQMDCKAHRADRRLEIRALHLYAGDFDAAELIDPFARAVRTFAEFQDCNQIQLTAATPARLAPQMTAALTQAPAD